ncbi:uncharacterized protein LOC114516462 isoform X2 [Dendronephthya gigantea]|uniref:uncharacterized protein LOC114516462 isoform X2 n=1 Tax=Dendronephthya gigantea TaxID=151771 RepID=UPI00106B6D7F|nr:uncharacterized protein LOC114516462 isoform X2 [Dendronephthya gigantea]
MVSSSSGGVFRNTAFVNTTYSSSFTCPGRREVIPKFNNYVSFVSSTEDKLVPRCFPHFALRVSPHRILDFEHSALGFGPTGAEYSDVADQRKQSAEEAEENQEIEADENVSVENSEDCGAADISESKQEESEEADSRNQKDERADTNSFQKEDSENSEKMAPRRRVEIPKHFLDEVTANIYKSTARKAAEEWALPVPERPLVFPQIIGNNEDRELYHSVYRRTGTWKTNVVPEAWERGQVRPLYEDPKAKQYRPYRLRFRPAKTRLLSKRHQEPSDQVTMTEVKPQESLPPAIQHIRPSPGYAGFVPKLPAIPSPPRDPRLRISLSSATYRNLSRDSLGVLEYAHKGPLSKLVTTTTPCNPFNKTTQVSQLTSGIFVF